MHVRSLAAASLFAVLGGSAVGCYVVPAGPPPADYQPVSEYTPPPPPPAYYTPAPVYTPAPAYGYQQPPTTTVVEVYYDQPAPQPITYYEPNVVWFYGPHPVTPGYGGGWCPIQGPHAHEYEPAWNYVYSFYDGYYFYAGDPQPYGYSDVTYEYIDAHPNPWGGWCYIRGPHHHYYAPSREQAIYYQHGNDHVYTYHGSYDATYYAERAHYQADGHPISSTTSYTQHLQFRQTHNVMPVGFHPTVPIHSDIHPANDNHGMVPGRDERPITPVLAPGHDGRDDNRMEPNHGEANHFEPNHVEPNHGEPNRGDDRGGATWSQPGDHGVVPAGRDDRNDHTNDRNDHANDRNDGHGPDLRGPQPGHDANGRDDHPAMNGGHEPAGHVEPAREPKNEPRNEPKVEPRNEPKVEPRNEPAHGGVQRVPGASPTATPESKHHR